jgi:ATP-dependent Clp protease ATP-binding subunit ClpA
MGATTIEEYRKYIEKDTALARRFQVGSGSSLPFFVGASDARDVILIFEDVVF